MKIGMDLHGVIEDCPELFSELSQIFTRAGHEVHIVTGPSISQKLKEGLIRSGIAWTHLFSIVDFHIALRTPMEFDSKGDPWIDAYLWDKTKAEYCEREAIDLHFDDSNIYSYFFRTPYARFYSKNTSRERKMRI